ncbi:RUN domain-containing protein 1-like isoform X2 [Bolinopsis microptera]|uniref:RUN domain-containing protein 1-like isoform X2 n=1 Tax=Bolinopsis microptera TaxID=2820187 RepID=UPI00307A231D
MVPAERPSTPGNSSNGSLRQLEELEVGQESLNNSLLALTSHFAQVQFRLRQITQSESSDRDALLQELEKFAFTGCQDLPSYEDVHESICSTFERRLSEQKAKHEELIFQLKFQLKDLEQYAKQSSEIKTNEQIRRHKLVLEQIKNYLKIDISDLYRLPSDELQDKVEEAVQDMLAPIKSKEQMLFQLTTQVQDLERFIEFLHGTGTTPNALSHEIRRCTCNCPLHGEPHEAQKLASVKSKNMRADSVEFLSKTLLMFQVLVINSLRVIGCQWRNHDKTPTYMCHVRKLEESVDNLIRTYHSSTPEIIQDLLLEMVRRKVAVPLRMLFSHGLKSQKKESLALVSCATKNRQFSKGVHPWNLFLEFYKLQHGKSFTEQPQYQLSQSFGLRIQRQSINSKQSLLSCIHKVRESHEPFKRSSDAKFKALIVHGINDGMLGQWIRVLANSDTLQQQVYEPWSYMSKHGFSDAMMIVDRLANIKFDLPTDTALKIFHVPEITETPIY